VSFKPRTAVAYAQIGHPHRKSPMLFALFVENGLLRAELCKNSSHPAIIWKLDDLHEALILQLLRERRSRLRAQIHRSLDPDRAAVLEAEYQAVKQAMIDAGNVMPTKSEVSE